MKNWAYFLLGEDRKNLEGHGPESTKKIKILALVVLLPALIWLVLGYSFGSNFLHLGLMSSIICGSVAAVIILIVDRIVIMASTSSRLVKASRILLALMVAIIGAIIVDHIVFEEDIRMTMEEIKMEKVDSRMKKIDGSYLLQLDAYESRIEQLSEIAIERQNDYLKEADGSGGTGTRGVREVALAKYDVWKDVQSEVEGVQAERKGLLETIKAEKLEATRNEDLIFSHSALLTQIKAMFIFLKSNPIALVLWIPISLIMFLLEILPLILKAGMEETAYEQELKYLEEMKKRRLELMRKELEEGIQWRSKYSETDRRAEQVLSTYRVKEKAA